jgi:hypothetical protein
MRCEPEYSDSTFNLKFRLPGISSWILYKTGFKKIKIAHDSEPVTEIAGGSVHFRLEP